MRRILYQRKAFTLIEVVAVLGCMSIILGVAMTLFYQMFQLQKRSREISEWTRSTNRFVNVFRDDVHRFGKPVIVSENEVVLRWQEEDSVIEYKLDVEKHVGQIIRRLETANEKIQSREEYRLPGNVELWFAEGTDKYEGLVALSLWQRPHGQSLAKVKIEDLNPFDRTWMLADARQEVPPPGVWRTALVCTSKQSISH